MIVALSVYSGDAPAALRLLEWINELGGVNSHTLVLATTPQVNAAPLVETARKGWAGVEQFLVNAQDDTHPWPVGANLSFFAICNRLKDRGRPWLMLESDCIPISGNWLDLLEREYHSQGKPFMGVVHSMVNPATGQVMPDSLHMNGAGIYPANVDRHLPTLPFLTGALLTVPWDVSQLRYEILNEVLPTGGFKLDDRGQRVSACHATDKICFCWRTRNYRVENDELKYDVDGPRAHAAQLDFWKHVLHHGCKDGSLIDVLRQRLNPKPKLATKIVEPPKETLPSFYGRPTATPPDLLNDVIVQRSVTLPVESLPSNPPMRQVAKLKRQSKKEGEPKRKRGRPPKKIEPASA